MFNSFQLFKLFYLLWRVQLLICVPPPLAEDLQIEEPELMEDYYIYSQNSKNSSNLTYTSNEKSVECHPTDRMKYPKNLDEVQNLVREAIRDNKTIKGIGSRFSTTDILCTEGIPVDLRYINHMELTQDDKLVVGAGALLRDVGIFLHSKGRAFRFMPGFGGITMAGLIGTNSRGSSLKYNASLSNQLIGLTIVDGLGEVVRVTNDDDLKAFRTHLGLLGMIFDLTFDTVPQYKMRIHNYATNETILSDGTALKIALNDDSVTFYWFPSLEKVVVSKRSIVPMDMEGDDEVNHVLPSLRSSVLLFSGLSFEKAAAHNDFNALNTIQKYFFLSLFTQEVPDIPPILSNNPGIGYSHKMLVPNCQKHKFGCRPRGRLPIPFRYIIQDMMMDLKEFENIINATKEILAEGHAVFPLNGLRIQFTGKNGDNLMAPEESQVHLEWRILKREHEYSDAPAGMEVYQAMMQTYAFRFNGKSHWAHTGNFYHSEEMIARRLSPDKRLAFIEAMERFDPNGIFLNSIGRRIKGISKKMDLDTLAVHCALHDNCICRMNTSDSSDCPSGRFCSDIRWGYPVCEKPELLVEDDNVEPKKLETDPVLTHRNMSDYFSHYTNDTSIFFYLYFYLSHL